MYLDNGVGKVLLIHRIYWHNRIMLNFRYEIGVLYFFLLAKICNLEIGDWERSHFLLGYRRAPRNIIIRTTYIFDVRALLKAVI